MTDYVVRMMDGEEFRLKGINTYDFKEGAIALGSGSGFDVILPWHAVKSIVSERLVDGGNNNSPGDPGAELADY